MMHVKLPLFFLILSCIPAFLPAQSAAKEQNSRLLSHKDSLWLTVDNGKKFIYHPVKAKQTLYSITRFYSLGMEELYEHNPQFREDPTLHAGRRIKIPVPNRAIKRYKGPNFVVWKNIPIYYVVTEGDNLYQICKRYFDMPVDSIKVRNKLKTNQLKPGQFLLVGWMGTEGVLPEWRPAREAEDAAPLKTRFETEKKNRQEVVSQGVCFWQKDSHERGDLYALHREAAIGTIIAVTNPIYDRTVYAKVIGRIPLAGYDKNTEVILSPEAARKIGAKDPKFFVKIKYLK
jgi:LysM repeat protein